MSASAARGPAPKPTEPVPEPTEPALTRLVLILGLAGFASTFGGRSLEPLVGVVARDLGTDVHTIALLSTAYALPYALVQPVLGPIGDALGKERVMTACLGLMSAAMVACIFAPSAPVLFVLRVVAGGAAGGVIPLVLATMGDAVPLARRQVAIGRLLVATIMGQLLGSTAAGVLESSIGWRGAFTLNAGVALVGFGAALLGFRRAIAAAPARRFDPREAWRRYAGIVRRPRARVLFGSVFVEAIAVFGIFPYLAPLIEGRGEGGAREAGLAIAGFAAGGLLYAALVGVLLRLLGLRRMLIAGGIVCAGALVVVGLAGRWQVDAAALVALGLGFYMLHNSYQTQVTEVAPEARASATSLHAFSFFCGQALGVAFLGASLGGLGQFGALALCAGLIAALGIASAWLLTVRYAPGYPAAGAAGAGPDHPSDRAATAASGDGA